LLYSTEGREAAPRYHSFLQKESLRAVSFSSALCNATSSDVSYASIFTGLSPEESDLRFHTNPLIWSIAHAKGYRTSLYSSQTMKWCNMEAFLLDETLDRFCSCEVLKAPIFNDLSMDDYDLNPIIIAELTKEEKPFCAVVNYNMLHYPYFDGKSKLPTSEAEARERYLSALRKFDTCLGNLLDSLEKSGKLENTAVFFTGDHGELPEKSFPIMNRPIHMRLNDFNSDVVRIPFWIRLPVNATSRENLSRLRANSNTIVSNVDIYPTLMHLLGWDSVLQTKLSSGQSLFDPIRKDRNSIVLNTGVLREWKYEPFAVGRDGWLFIYHDVIQKIELIRMDDPKKKDVWKTTPESVRAAWLGDICKIQALSDILSRWKGAFPKKGS
ncbi:MAG: sulfatase-like hydrolase/transferase, partial [Bacteroidales bacterium]